MNICINTKTGFLCSDKLVFIQNAKGLFYCKKNNHKQIYFNLPAGSYFTNNTLIPTEARKFKIAFLPPANNPRPMHENLEVIHTTNPNKCQIDLNTGKIYLDNQFKEVPNFVTDFIIGHEIGHYFYSGQGQKSEQLCDAFSYNLMIEKGYNPSQIMAAIDLALSNRAKSTIRKHKLKKIVNNAFNK